MVLKERWGRQTPWNFRENELWLQLWILPLFRQVSGMSAHKNLCYLRAGWGEGRSRIRQSCEAPGLYFPQENALIFLQDVWWGRSLSLLQSRCFAGMAEEGQTVASSPFKPVHAIGTKEFAYILCMIWLLLAGFGHYKEKPLSFCFPLAALSRDKNVFSVICLIAATHHWGITGADTA